MLGVVGSVRGCCLGGSECAGLLALLALQLCGRLLHTAVCQGRQAEGVSLLPPAPTTLQLLISSLLNSQPPQHTPTPQMLLLWAMMSTWPC